MGVWKVCCVEGEGRAGVDAFIVGGGAPPHCKFRRFRYFNLLLIKAPNIPHTEFVDISLQGCKEECVYNNITQTPCTPSYKFRAACVFQVCLSLPDRGSASMVVRGVVI